MCAVDQVMKATVELFDALEVQERGQKRDAQLRARLLRA